MQTPFEGRQWELKSLPVKIEIAADLILGNTKETKVRGEIST